MNNSIVCIDPISLSVYNTVYLKLEDYKISNNLSKILYKISPKLFELQKKSINFKDYFKDNVITEDGKMYVTSEVFYEQFLLKNFKSVLGFDKNDYDILIQFID